MTVTIGELCMGYGGLGMGLSMALGVPTRVAWAVEYDKHPSAIIAHRYPGVPNYGDVNTAPWDEMEPVDWLTAGYPCQPFSHAGKRKGSDDPRHLWPGVARAIGLLRPPNVLLENVAGHVSLGLDAVLADLASLGYDATWGVVRAADAGAPHGRARVFIVARPSGGGLATDSRLRGWGQADPRGCGLVGEGGLQAGRHEGAGSHRPDRPPAPDPRGERHGRGQDAAGLGRLDLADAGPARERERARGVAVDRGAAAAADAAGDGLQGRPRLGHDPAAGGQRAGDVVGVLHDDVERAPAPYAEGGSGQDEPRSDDPGRPVVGPGLGAGSGTGAGHPAPGVPVLGRGAGQEPVQWGAYAPAIVRWERVLGRPVPRPTEPGRSGERLSPRFVEWMQGLPDGWVTDVPGLPRNAMLKALGNGVVPHQAALACRLLGVIAPAVAA